MKERLSVFPEISTPYQNWIYLRVKSIKNTDEIVKIVTYPPIHLNQNCKNMETFGNSHLIPTHTTKQQLTNVYFCATGTIALYIAGKAYICFYPPVLWCSLAREQSLVAKVFDKCSQCHLRFCRKCCKSNGWLLKNLIFSHSKCRHFISRWKIYQICWTSSFI